MFIPFPRSRWAEPIRCQHVQAALGVQGVGFTQALDSLFGSEPSHPCSVLDDCAWHGQQVMVGGTDQGSDLPKLRARAPDIPTCL